MPHLPIVFLPFPSLLFPPNPKIHSIFLVLFRYILSPPSFFFHQHSLFRLFFFPLLANLISFVFSGLHFVLNLFIFITRLRSITRILCNYSVPSFLLFSDFFFWVTLFIWNNFLFFFFFFFFFFFLI